MLSGLSLSAISNIAVQALPIFKEDLANSDHYTFGEKGPYFEENAVETRNFNLANNLMRSTSTRISNDSKELIQRPTPTRLGNGLVTERKYLSIKRGNIRKLKISQPLISSIYEYEPFMEENKMAIQQHDLATVEEESLIPPSGPLTGSYNFFDSNSGLYECPDANFGVSAVHNPSPKIPVLCFASSRVRFGDKTAKIVMACTEYLATDWPYLTYELNTVSLTLLVRRLRLITL
jgi:hypothetical protein